MKVRELITKLLNCDLDSEVIIQATGGVGNSKITVIGNEIKDIYEKTEFFGTLHTIIQANFHDTDKDGFQIRRTEP